MGLVPQWFKEAKWVYRIGDWVGDFASDVTAVLLVEVKVHMFTDTTFPLDAMECVVYFAVDRSLEPAQLDPRADLDGLCQEVGEAFDAHWGGSGGALQVLARIIETSSESSTNRTEKGAWEARPDVEVGSACPREVALCLSYFGGRNLPGLRGRIFLPVPFTGAGAGGRPPDTLMMRTIALGHALADVGGTGTQWSIYSRTQGVAFSITDFWVDNEWDTQRSRGLSSTRRFRGTTAEAAVS